MACCNADIPDAVPPHFLLDPSPRFPTPFADLPWARFAAGPTAFPFTAFSLGLPPPLGPGFDSYIPRDHEHNPQFKTCSKGNKTSTPEVFGV
jgi:hypothetical protein